MANPQMPNIPGIPGAGAMADTLDFVKNLWGSMSVPGVSIPGMAAPTMNVDELDKKIGDLKAVESWLNVNMSMLRGTIQALEVQRSTIETLKSMSSTFAAAIKQPPAVVEQAAPPTPFTSAFFPQAGAAQPAQTSAEPPAPADAAASDALPLTNPSAWWNLLQDQFKQAVTTAMASDAVANATALATDAATKFSAASAKPATQMSKTSSETLAKKAPARPSAAAKTPAKRAPAKPKPGKARSG